MNEEIKEKIEFLKNIIKKDITWNSLPEKYLEEIEEYINNLIFCVKKSQSKIDKAIELIKIEKEEMGYAKYDSCLLLIENILKEDK